MVVAVPSQAWEGGARHPFARGGPGVRSERGGTEANSGGRRAPYAPWPGGAAVLNVEVPAGRLGGHRALGGPAPGLPSAAFREIRRGAIRATPSPSSAFTRAAQTRASARPARCPSYRPSRRPARAVLDQGLLRRLQLRLPGALSRPGGRRASADRARGRLRAAGADVRGAVRAVGQGRQVGGPGRADRAGLGQLNAHSRPPRRVVPVTRESPDRPPNVAVWDR